jgi:hypothetical protein
MKNDIKERVFYNKEKFKDGLYVIAVLFEIILKLNLIKDACPQYKKNLKEENFL